MEETRRSAADLFGLGIVPYKTEGDPEVNAGPNGKIEVISNDPEEYKTPYQRYLEAKELLEKEIRTFLNAEALLIDVIKKNGSEFNDIWTWNPTSTTFIRESGYKYEYEESRGFIIVSGTGFKVSLGVIRYSDSLLSVNLGGNMVLYTPEGTVKPTLINGKQVIDVSEAGITVLNQDREAWETYNEENKVYRRKAALIRLLQKLVPGVVSRLAESGKLKLVKPVKPVDPILGFESATIIMQDIQRLLKQVIVQTISSGLVYTVVHDISSGHFDEE